MCQKLKIKKSFNSGKLGGFEGKFGHQKWFKLLKEFNTGDGTQECLDKSGELTPPPADEPEPPIEKAYNWSYGQDPTQCHASMTYHQSTQGKWSMTILGAPEGSKNPRSWHGGPIRGNKPYKQSSNSCHGGKAKCGQGSKNPSQIDGNYSNWHEESLEGHT